MPTSRAASFLLAALALYFFANQTQVGWLYVMSALLAGTVLAAWWLGRSALHHISADRTVGRDGTQSALYETELYEGEAVTVGLTLRNTGRANAALIRAVEHCPFAAPPVGAMNSSPLQIFVPSLPANGSVRLDYEVIVDRRGLHEFPALKLNSRAPFGFFQRRRTLPAPTRVLVYPEVRRLRRLNLLDRQPAAQLSHPRAGLGTEIIGVRAFRSGDSPRHIHWRTVARTGQLASKEFADETQPGLTLALDLFRHPYPPEGYQPSGGLKKHTPFEYAVKIAASVGDYALRRNYPVHLATDSSAWPAPSGAVTRIALLEYLARVQPVGTNKLADVLNNRAAQTFVAVILSWPDSTVVESLVALRHHGLEVLVVLLDRSHSRQAALQPAPSPTNSLPFRPRIAAHQVWRRLDGRTGKHKISHEFREFSRIESISQTFVVIRAIRGKAMTLFNRATKLIAYSLGLLSALAGLFALIAAAIHFTPLRLFGGIIFLAGAAVLFYIPRLAAKFTYAIRKEPEKSLRLRWLTFGAQLTGLLALGYTSHVWVAALLSAALLVFGHRYALYHIQHKSIPTVRVAIFAAFHLAFLWMIAGLFTGQPYPQAQFAMLAMGIVSFEQFSRLNLYSGFGLALINLYVAATLSRNLAFALFLTAFLILFLAFFWQADSEDGVKDNPTVLRSWQQTYPQGATPTTNAKRED